MHYLLGKKLKTFGTKYDENISSHGKHGLTFKKTQVKESTKFQEVSICFRVNIDRFAQLGKYISLLEMIDNGGLQYGSKK